MVRNITDSMGYVSEGMTGGETNRMKMENFLGWYNSGREVAYDYGNGKCMCMEKQEER